MTCDYAQQTAVITLAGLRRLRLRRCRAERAARAYLAALGLLALVEADAQGYALRSRCDLVCDGEAPVEFVRLDGKARAIDLDLTAARDMHTRLYATTANSAGFELGGHTNRLQPQDKLVHIVRESQEKALGGGRRAGRGGIMLSSKSSGCWRLLSTRARLRTDAPEWPLSRIAFSRR